MEFINPKSEIYRIIKKHALARPGGARKLGLLSEQIVVATTVAQLPADMAAVVKSSFLYNKDLDANWQLFCNIMQLGTPAHTPSRPARVSSPLLCSHEAPHRRVGGGGSTDHRPQGEEEQGGADPGGVRWYVFPSLRCVLRSRASAWLTPARQRWTR